MTDRREPDEALKKAFQSLADTTDEGPSAADNDLVWRALSGELPASERRALVDRMSRDPALAESWRIAHEVSRETSAQAPASVSRVRGWMPAWLAAAAALFVTVGIAVVFQLSRPGVDDTFRDGRAYVVQSLVPSDTALPRNAFRLRWTPGPAGARYTLRVTTEDLRVLATASDVTSPEYVVSSDLLSTVPSGARVFWQVDAVLPEGNTVSSQTFVARVQ